MRISITTIYLLASAVLLGACSSTPVNPEFKAPVEEHSMAPVTTTDTGNIQQRAVETVQAVETNALNDPKEVLAKRSVYFDYDSYIVKEEFKSLIEAHAKYIAASSGRKIIIQGNTDERGGSEYNLALGQKRAEAVRRALSLLGVTDSQMEAVSLGKEKPKAVGSNEAAWAENRRADIIYQ